MDIIEDIKNNNLKKINYTDMYKNISVRCSYKNDAGHESLCVGYIIAEDSLNIIIDTNYNKRVLIRKELIGNIKGDLKVGVIDNDIQKRNIKD